MILYTAEVIEKIENRPGTWNYLRVGVFRGEGPEREQVGEYIRNYSNLYRSFCSFQQEGKDYALYSPSYTATRIMELPSCKDIGGEEVHGYGFCPVDYHVPRYLIREYAAEGTPARRQRINEPAPDDENERTYSATRKEEATGERIAIVGRSYSVSPVLFYPFGFVAGCVWGDDSSWKIQYLDLQDASRGILRREERFGYIVLPRKMTLNQAVHVQEYGTDPAENQVDRITVAIEQQFNRQTGEVIPQGWDD